MRILFVAALCLLPLAAQAQNRIALVIGMGAYEQVPVLDNPANDARVIGETLRSIGFDVTTLIDVPGEELRAEVDQFSFRSETADLALIYYAGHGRAKCGSLFWIPAAMIPLVGRWIWPRWKTKHPHPARAARGAAWRRLRRTGAPWWPLPRVTAKLR